MEDVFGSDKVGVNASVNSKQPGLPNQPSNPPYSATMSDGVSFHYNPTINVSSNTNQDSKNNPSLSEVGSLLLMLGGLLSKFIK